MTSLSAHEYITGVRCTYLLLLIEMINVNLFSAMPCLQLLQKSTKELLGEFIYVLPGVLSNQLHLPYVAFRLRVTFEPVLIPALFFTGLAIETESLQAFGFDAVPDRLRGARLSARHVGRSP